MTEPSVRELKLHRLTAGGSCWLGPPQSSRGCRGRPLDGVRGILQKGQVLDQYRSLSFTHQREYNLWIEDAKQAETRKRRIEKAIEQFRAKNKRD
jgi:hypothetical protein